MDLQSIASQVLSANVAPTPVTVRVSVGQGPTEPDGKRPELYATPGAIVASIAGTVMTVSAVSAGVLQNGQTIAGAGVAPGTSIVEQIDGTAGGAGNYSVSVDQDVASEAMTTALELLGDVQPITWRDLQQLDGLNLGGVKWKIYLHGEVDSIVRPERKGGDLVVLPATSRHAGLWLVVQVLEQFPDWCCAAIVLQQNSGG